MILFLMQNQQKTVLFDCLTAYQYPAWHMANNHRFG